MKITQIITKEKIQIISSFAFGAVLTILFCFLADQNKMKIDISSENEEGKLIARSGGENIYLTEINKKLAQINPNLNFESLEKAEDKEAIIKEVLIQKLILKNSIKSNSHKKYSESLKSFAQMEARENYLKDTFESQITEELLKNKYDEIAKELLGKKEYEISHILSKSKKDSYKAFSALSNRSFEEVAQSQSIDDNTAKNGGNLGYIIEGGMIKEVEDQIKKMKTGSISKPLKTNLGWHIIKLNNVRNVELPEFSKIKNNIKSSMFSESKQKIASDLIKDLEIEML